MLLTKLHIIWLSGFRVFRLLTDFVCLYNYEFWLSLCKTVRSSVILLLPLFTIFLNCSFTQKSSLKKDVYYKDQRTYIRHLILFMFTTLVNCVDPLDSMFPAVKIIYMYIKIGYVSFCHSLKLLENISAEFLHSE